MPVDRALRPCGGDDGSSERVQAAVQAPGDAFEFSRVRTAASHIAMRFRLSHSDAEDLHGDLWVRLLANEGHVLRSYRGTARIETYLMTIARNLVLDGRRRVHGKWRPSARARRFGLPAIELERLIAHQGFSAAIAIGRVAARWPDAESGSAHRVRGFD